MSKTFVLKRNPSHDERSAYVNSELRSRSLSRAGIYCPYTKSDYAFDGSFKCCPVHDSPRNNYYYSPQFETLANEYPESKHPKRSSSQRYSSVDGHSSKYRRHRKSSPSPCGRSELRRKTVFVLHEEIRKSPSTTILEEISDMDRITEMCMSTLKSMMESKKYRRYLHHMNNNNSQPWGSHLNSMESKTTHMRKGRWKLKEDKYDVSRAPEGRPEEAEI